VLELSTTLVLAGFSLIFAGILALIFYSFKTIKRRDTQDNEGKADVSAGGVIFLGPFPIVFGSNKKIAKWMLVVALIITILLIFQTLLFVGVI
jgi:uncharacterized protein (TIGR00304 family)